MTSPGSTAPHLDLEKGEGGTGIVKTSPMTPSPQDPHAIFCSSIGITTTPTGALQGGKTNIYQWTLTAEKHTKLKFWACASLLNSCLLLQVGVGAILTALGASSSPHAVITVFAALNTVIAGLLTYLKGQGLPNRLRKERNGFRRVREYIEEREVDFRQVGCKLVPKTEIEAVRKMYQDVRDTAEANEPDTYVTTTPNDGVPSGLGKPVQTTQPQK